MQVLRDKPLGFFDRLKTIYAGFLLRDMSGWWRVLLFGRTGPRPDAFSQPPTPSWLSAYYRRDAAKPTRFALRVDGGLLEADAFGGIIEQMRARGFSTDDLVTAALLVLHTPRGAEMNVLPGVARSRIAADLDDLRCQDPCCTSQGEGEAIVCERCQHVGCTDCIAFDDDRKMYICDLCPEQEPER